MIDILLKILSVLGSLLLVLVILAVTVILLVLFFPVTYRISGKKSLKEMKLSIKLSWLFGLFRVRYDYPTPGLLTAKLLWFRLYEMKLPPDKKEKEAADSPNTGGGSADDGGTEAVGNTEANRKTEAVGEGCAEKKNIPPKPEGEPEQGTEETENTVSGEPSDIFSEKFAKIKYTILNIYDKIKKIWENISYYLSVLQEENTKQLSAKVRQRLAKLLKSIRPRHVKADILFGTGSPDTTGYVYGVYCMLLPYYGSKFLATPDFEQAVFQGEFEMSGHVVAFILLVNVLKVAFDRRLYLLIKKLKREEVKNGR